MAFIKVKNMSGTAGQTPPPPYEKMSWLEYWEEKTGNRAPTCGVWGCYSRAEHGGHVKKCDNFFDTKSYIVPLCARCNNPNNTEEFYVDCDLCPID